LVTSFPIAIDPTTDEMERVRKSATEKIQKYKKL